MTKSAESVAVPKVFQRRPNSRVVHTGGEIFSDGSILELIRNPGDGLGLLISKGKDVQTTTQFARQGKTFIPLRLDPTILRSLRLPSCTTRYGSTRKLYTEISDLISRVVLVREVAQLLTFMVLATWVTASLPIAPIVWIAAPSMTAASPLAQLLGLLCRRVLAVSDISPAAFYSLPMDLRPTLLAHVLQPTRGLLKLLRTSTRRGAFVVARGKLVEPCAKIVIAAEPLRDPASAGFPLELVLAPARDTAPLLTSAEADRVAGEYQAKLLQYWLENWGKVSAPAFELRQFTAPMQDVASTLGSAIVGDAELQATIVPLLRPLDREIQLDRTTSLEAIVLEGLLARCHSTTGRNFPVSDLTAAVNTILRHRGEVIEVSPEVVGWKLRALGLRTDFMPGGRKGIKLPDEVRKRVHDLAALYGVRTLRVLPATTRCEFCMALARSGQAPGTELRC